MAEITLKDFIAATLDDIVEGVRAANDAHKARYRTHGSPFYLKTQINDPKAKAIEFDVAIVASRDATEKKGFGITLINIGAGASAEKNNLSEVTHRIRFEVSPMAGIHD